MFLALVKEEAAAHDIWGDSHCVTVTLVFLVARSFRGMVTLVKNRGGVGFGMKSDGARTVYVLYFSPRKFPKLV